VALADFVNGDAMEIAFGANMTTLTFHLARGLAARWSKGDEVVVTELDHHGNVAPWTRLAAERGIVVKTVRMIPEEGVLDWTSLEQAITPRTRLLAIGAASNALGTVTDVAAAARLAQAHGALTFVDAVHYAPHVLVDVKALGCDFLGCSAYKFYGPHVGMLWGKRDLIASLDVPKLIPAPEAPPERLETGTQNHEGIVGAAAAVDYLASFGTGASRRDRLISAFAGLHEQGTALLERMWNGLSAIRGVRMYGCAPGKPRTPTVSFVVDGMVSDDVARGLARQAVFVSNGDFYATTVIERLGHAADGVVRAGCACYTTADEVDRLIEGVADIARD
jgi:cysteine desulfurase family protein (TIGR01976 family)